MENDITTGAAAHTQDDEGRWGTVAETAQVFGVSADTIRQRIKRGELETRREQTPQGFRWLIHLPELDTAPATSSEAPGSPGSDDQGMQGYWDRLRRWVTGRDQ